MKVKYSCPCHHTKEQGVGLVEVIIALVIIMIAALGIGNLQTSSLTTVQASSVHFAVDQLSSEMLETIRANSAAAASGSFDLADGTSSNDEVLAWNARVAENISTGVGNIECSSDFCDVVISWTEEIDGTDSTKSFETRTPL